MKKTLAITTLAIFSAGAFLFGWQYLSERARAAKIEAETLSSLTAEEIGSILRSEAELNKDLIAQFNQNAEKRSMFLRGMREYLALAAEARREGFADNENFRILSDYKKNILIADLYAEKLRGDSSTEYRVPPEEETAFWKREGIETQFTRDLEAMKTARAAELEAVGREDEPFVLEGDALQKVRQKWSRTFLLNEKARNDADFMNRPAIALRLKIIDAGLLANDYLKAHWKTDIKASNSEIENYLQANPQYDIGRKRELAETILKRALAGEKFEILAAEFSEDRGTKNKGGLYADISPETIWSEVEAAALDLRSGAIADRVVESSQGFHIVKLEKRSGGKFSLRHIMLQKAFEEPGSNNRDVPPPFMKPEEIAKNEIEKTKREQFIRTILEKNPVTLPDDFVIGQ